MPLRLVVAALIAFASPVSAAEKPNIVVILADDRDYVERDSCFHSSNRLENTPESRFHHSSDSGVWVEL